MTAGSGRAAAAAVQQLAMRHWATMRRN